MFEENCFLRRETFSERVGLGRNLRTALDSNSGNVWFRSSLLCNWAKENSAVNQSLIQQELIRLGVSLLLLGCKFTTRLPFNISSGLPDNSSVAIENKMLCLRTHWPGYESSTLTTSPLRLSVIQIMYLFHLFLWYLKLMPDIEW